MARFELVTCKIVKKFGPYFHGEEAGFSPKEADRLEREGFVVRVQPFRDSASTAATVAPKGPAADKAVGTEWHPDGSVKGKRGKKPKVAKVEETLGNETEETLSTDWGS